MSDILDIPLMILPERYAVCRLAQDTAFPAWARPGDLLALVRTSDELSVLCLERYVPPEVKAELGWRVIKVQGPLDFSYVGVLSSIAAPLAQAGVSIFAVSTYDTDYILVKENSLDQAVEALNMAGFLVLNHVRLSS